MIDQLHYILAAISGVAVGFTLGLVGGGGSILAVPLMVYVVGVKSPHVAIGTSALAVAANALAGLATHARNHNVNWRCGGTFAFAGVLGALAGSTLGKAVDGQKLLFLFALLMIVVAVAMYRGRAGEGPENVACNRDNMGKVLGFGFGTGALSGFFGIGGGFLIVPALVASTSMAIYRAVGTSLVAVSAFGLATAGFLCLFGAGGLAAGCCVYRRRRCGQRWRHDSLPPPVGPEGAPQYRVFRADHGGCALHADAQRNGHSWMTD